MFGRNKNNEKKQNDFVDAPEAEEYSVLIHFVQPTPCVYVKKNDVLESYDGEVLIDFDHMSLTVHGNFVIADCLTLQEVNTFLTKFNMNGDNSIRFDM